MGSARDTDVSASLNSPGARRIVWAPVRKSKLTTAASCVWDAAMASAVSADCSVMLEKLEKGTSSVCSLPVRRSTTPSLSCALMP